jgi:GAF domain-containing protein
MLPFVASVLSEAPCPLGTHWNRWFSGRPGVKGQVTEPSSVVGAAAEAAELGLASALAQMSQVLLAAQTAETAVDLVGELAAAVIPGTIGAGVTIVDGHGKRSRAATNALVEEADALQYQFDAGPCLSAWRDRTAVRIDDLESELRWPHWTAWVASLGVRSMVSVPMVAGGKAVGAIKVYSDQANVYGSDTERLLELFADQAAVLLANTQTIAEARQLSARMSEMLDRRDVIAQATGVMLAHGAADTEASFVLLLAAAHDSKVTLFDAARAMIDRVVARNAEQASDADRP